MEKVKFYVQIKVNNPYAKEMKNQPEKEVRRYRIKELKDKCFVLFDGRQFPYSAIENGVIEVEYI